jgi:hypothetical protein
LLAVSTIQTAQDRLVWSEAELHLPAQSSQDGHNR